MRPAAARGRPARPGARLQKEIRDAEAKDVEAMKKRGLTVVPVSAAQRAAVAEAHREPLPADPRQDRAGRGLRRGDALPRRVPQAAGRGGREVTRGRGGRRSRAPSPRRPRPRLGRAVRRLEHGFLIAALLAAAFLPLADTLGRPFGVHVPGRRRLPAAARALARVPGRPRRDPRAPAPDALDRRAPRRGTGPPGRPRARRRPSRRRPSAILTYAAVGLVLANREEGRDAHGRRAGLGPRAA